MWQHCTHSISSSPPIEPCVELTILPSRDTQHPKSPQPSTKAATTSRTDNKSAAATTLTATTTTKASTSASVARGKSSPSRRADFTLVVSPRLRRVVGNGRGVNRPLQARLAQTALSSTRTALTLDRLRTLELLATTLSAALIPLRSLAV